MFNYKLLFSGVLSFLLAFSAIANPIPNDGVDDSDAIEQLLLDALPGDVITLEPGYYDICSTIYASKLENVTLKGLGDGEVHLTKCNNFNGEYLLFIFNSDQFKIDNIRFYGLTKEHYVDSLNKNIVWGEQGVLFAGTTNSSVTNSGFFDFGDAGLRVTSSLSHPSQLPINSKNFTATYNVFYNVTQVTTTHSWSKDFGGTENITFKYNLFSNIKGGLKLASRKYVEKAEIAENSFVDIYGSAIELVYYSDVDVKNNNFTNIHGFVMNVYPNSPSAVNEPIDWNDITFIANSVAKSKGGLRFKSDNTGELINDKYIRGILISKNSFIDVDMTVYKENTQYYNVVNMYSYNKKYIFTAVRDNVYSVPSNVKFFNGPSSLDKSVYNNVNLSVND